MARMGQLRQVFSSGISFGLKIRIYKAAICSLFTYGSEAWTLDENTRAIINGVNARCLNRITGRVVHVEASARTRTYDLVGDIRKRKYKWLGHILRMDRSRLVKHAAAVQFASNRHGNIFMDAPAHFEYRELEQLARLRDRWKQRNFTPLPQRPIPSASTNTTTRAARQRLAQNTTLRPTVVLAKITATTTAPPLPRPSAACTSSPAKMMVLKQPKTKVKKAKPKGLTTPQRAAWAHAHYIVNHGTAADAQQFLSNHIRAGNAPLETLKALKQMCPAPHLPTWDEARAAVFDSTFSSEDTDTWMEPAAAPDNTHPSDDTDTSSHWAEPAIMPDSDNNNTSLSSLWAEPAANAIVSTPTINATSNDSNKCIAGHTPKTNTKMIIPTWLEAKAAVFDSSLNVSNNCSSLNSNNSHTNSKRSIPEQTTTTAYPFVQGHHRPISPHKHHTHALPPLQLSPITPHKSVTFILPHAIQQTDTHIEWNTSHSEWNIPLSVQNKSLFEWNIYQTLPNDTIQLTL